MIVYCTLLATLLLSFTCIFILWPRQNFIQSWQSVLLAISLGTLVYLYGPWFFLTTYIRYVFAAALAILLLLYVVRRTEHAAKKARPLNAWPSVGTSVIFIVLCILYYTGTNGKPRGTANLAFPFKQGTYLVMQGGNGLPTNLFHYHLRGAVHAMDIVKLNKYGNRANTIFSNTLKDYAIYGDTVYSPCDGLVIDIENSNPDNKPGIIKRGPKNTNFVMIEAEQYNVLLAHFIPGSIMVREGQRIRTGDPLALAGNSGFSLEPHLHIQVHMRTNDSTPWYREPQLQIRFDNKLYLLFEVIKAGKH